MELMVLYTTTGLLFIVQASRGIVLPGQMPRGDVRRILEEVVEIVEVQTEGLCLCLQSL